MKKPKISVIVPVYNTAPWLKRCLDSICSQSYRDLEILCVNDGSTDNSAEILAEYAAKDTRIKVFTQPNAGLSAARNTGLAHASGEWVTGVDSDDYLYPGVYEETVSCISAKVDMVFFGIQDVAEDGSVLPHNAYFDLPKAGEYPMTPELAAQFNVCFVSKLWRRSVLEKNELRFPVGFVHEDEAMYYLAVPHMRGVAVCPKMGYAYMQREGSIMTAGGLDFVQRVARYEKILGYTYGEYERRGLLSGEARTYLVKMFVRICAPYYRTKPCEGGDAVRELLAGIIKKYGMSGCDYRLERFLPSDSTGFLRIKRRPCAKVYTVLGIPVWVKWYTYAGRRVTPAVLAFHFRMKFRRLLGR